MTSYAHIMKVFYRPCSSNNYSWKMREYAIVDKDTNKAAVVFDKTLKRKDARAEVVRPSKQLKRGGFLGSIKNRAKFNRFNNAVKSLIGK